MTHRSRRLIFLGFIILFIFLGSAIISYSFGWRLDLETLKLQKVGAIALETAPRGVIIKLNNKPVADESGLIQKHTLISGLLPKSYEVSVEKENYLPYQKTLEVKPSLVTEALNVVLIPANLSSSTQNLISGLKGGQIADFSAGNKVIIKSEKSAVFYLYNLNNSSSTFNINGSFANLRKNPPLEIKFHPFEPSQLLVETKGGLNIFDTEKLRAEAIIENPIQAWSIKNSAVYFIQTEDFFDSQAKTTSTAAFLYSFNLIFKNQTALLELEDKNISLPIVKIAVSNSGDKFALADSAGKLFLYSRAKNTFEKISDNAKFFEFSPNSAAIAFLDYNNRLSVRFLEDWHVSLRKKPGDEIPLELPQAASISDFSWYHDSFHLFINYFDRLDFAEIDTRSELNIYNIVQNFTDYFYIPAENKIYFIKNNALQSIALE